MHNMQHRMHISIECSFNTIPSCYQSTYVDYLMLCNVRIPQIKDKQLAVRVTLMDTL